VRTKFCVLIILILQLPILLNTARAGPSHQGAFFVRQTSYNLDGRLTEMDAVSFIENGRTFVPVRHLAMAPGVPDSKIVWNPSSRTVTLTKDNVKTVMNGIDLFMVEQVLFDRINENRLAVGLAKVEWDETAAKAARQFAIELAQNNFISHWNLSGKKPQQRYTEAGGIYGTTENVCFNWLKGYELSQSLVQNNVLKIHEEMMAEVPPDDGHRVNILDPHHTHVGVGVAYARQDDGSITIAFTQEFTNHYAELKDIPRVLKPGESFAITGSMRQPDLKLYSVILLWEEAPCPMSIGELKATRSYSSPDLDSMVSYAIKDWPIAYYPYVTATGNKLVIDGAGNFTTVLQAGEKEGLNYLQVWLEDTTGNKFIGNEFVIEVQNGQ